MISERKWEKDKTQERICGLRDGKSQVSEDLGRVKRDWSDRKQIKEAHCETQIIRGSTVSQRNSSPPAPPPTHPFQGAI